MEVKMAGEEEAGRNIENATLLRFVFHFCYLAELGVRRLGCPGMTRCSRGRDIGLKVENGRHCQGSGMPLPGPFGPNVAS